MVILRGLSIPLMISILIFLLSIYEGGFYLANGEPEIFTGLGVFFLEFSMLFIDMVYFNIYEDMPEFHKLELKILLVLVSITLLIIVLTVLNYFLKRIETVFIGDKMLKIGLRRIKSVLTLLIPLEIISLLESLNWALSEKGMFSVFGDNVESIIWNTVSISSSCLWVLFFIFSIKYINEFRIISDKGFKSGKGESLALPPHTTVHKDPLTAVPEN
ncbi:MAG: hypothetical protein ACJAUP_002493 [Cellvibrionaceae bacterium]|jgi:hypothetical protein